MWVHEGARGHEGCVGPVRRVRWPGPFIYPRRVYEQSTKYVVWCVRVLVRVRSYP